MDPRIEAIGKLPLSGTEKFIIQTMLLTGIKSTSQLASITGECHRSIQRAKVKFNAFNCDSFGASTPTDESEATDESRQMSRETTNESPPSRARIESSLREDTSLKKVAVVVAAAACADAPKVPSSKEDLDRLETQLLDACNGALDNPVNCSGLLNLGEPLSWLKAGCDLDLDVLPTLRAIGKREHGKRIGSWRYFQRAVLEAKTAREAGVSEGQDCHPGGRRFSDPQVAERWRQHNEYMRKARIECGLEVAP